MLQRFFFVGLGGSGGKTLRFLYQSLEEHLVKNGWTKGMPKGWQFLHIDVPITPDGDSPDLPPQLPSTRYVGMAPRGLGYRALDDRLLEKGDAVKRHVSGWRPDPSLVNITPTTGAGQYRAVGRAISGAAMKGVAEMVSKSIDALQDVDALSELSEISGLLTGNDGINAHVPQTLVISSIAGGSGAGALLDVCDLIRQVVPDQQWQDKLASILYLPEVFEELQKASRAGMNGNALAAMSELLAAYWNTEVPTEGEFSLLESAGVAIRQPRARGPRQMFMIGRSNGEITFPSQIDVYRAVSRSLAAWTTDLRVQDEVNTSIVGNYGQKADRATDRTKIAPHRSAPLSSLGYASVGLGMEKFARYSSERLAREAVNRLLEGHVTQAVRMGEETAEASAERLARQSVYAFLEHTGLRELGPQHNQVIDALRGGSENQARQAQMLTLRQMLRGRIGGVSKKEMKPETVQWALQGGVDDEWLRFHQRVDDTHQDHARVWVTEVQDRVTQQVLSLMGTLGAAATEAVLDLAIGEINDAVVPELRQMADQQRRVVNTGRQRIASIFQGFDGKLLPDNPLIDRSLNEALDSFHAEAEATLYELTAELLDDLCSGFLVPLRRALKDARLRLREDADTAVQRWAADVVPRSLMPAQNEVQLIAPEEFPGMFDQLVQASIGLPDRIGSRHQAVQQIIAGQFETASHPAMEITARWAPKPGRLNLHVSGAQAQFEVNIATNSLLGRAAAWTRQKETAMGRTVRADLAGYLDDADQEPQVRQLRLETFGRGLAQALQTARPLVHIDVAANTYFHGEDGAPRFNRVLSPLPFPDGHPARSVVEPLFRELTDAQRIRLFDDQPREHIDVMTFMDAPVQPPVIASLARPIADEYMEHQGQGDASGFWRWRRARPLPQAIPVPPDVRRAMVRGWLVARLMDQVKVGDPRREPVVIMDSDGTALAFPFPLLGEPVRQMENLLPAVLGSLPIALVADARTRLPAYHRLMDLGSPDGAGGDEVHADLERFLQGNAEARSTTLKTLDVFRKHYEEMPQGWTDESNLPLVAELRLDILTEVTQLRKLLGDAPSATGVWV